jgi:propanol-preferring alcohol dehydrogenase
MKAWRLEKIATLADDCQPLRLREIERPEPGPGQVLIKISACGVCHTELDEIEGRAAPPRLPITPGHQVVGRIVAGGKKFSAGTPAGVAWIFGSCGRCGYCREGRENLCPDFRGTGRDAEGGYAQFMIAYEDFVFAIPPGLDDLHAAPLLCAGAVGWRAVKLTELRDGQPLGLSGFGASGHLVLRMVRAVNPGSPIYVFTRRPEQQRLALELGARWAGDFDTLPPEPLAAVIDTTPAWKPVLHSLLALAPGGRLVINAIAKEDTDRELLAGLDYQKQLWQEKSIKSVANVTRADVAECLELAARAGIKPEIEVYPFSEANRALVDLSRAKARGAKVLRMEE